MSEFYNSSAGFSEDQQEAMRPVVAGLLRDFRLAFFFSQGEVNDPRFSGNAGLDFILCFVGYEYNRTLPAESPLFDNLPTLLQMAEASALHQGPPAAHRAITEEQRQLQLDDAWRVFSSVLRGDTTPYDAFSYDDYLRHMTSLMLTRDQHYVINGRPNRTADQDAYLSHFREYVLRGQRVGSPLFEGIFVAMRERHQSYLAASRSLSIIAYNLAKKWEAQHPGRRFRNHDSG